MRCLTLRFTTLDLCVQWRHAEVPPLPCKLVNSMGNMQVCQHILPALAVFGEELPPDTQPLDGRLQVAFMRLVPQLHALAGELGSRCT